MLRRSAALQPYLLPPGPQHYRAVPKPLHALHALAGLPKWTGMRADGSVSADRVALGAKKVLGDCSRILIFDNSGRVLYSSFPVRSRLERVRAYFETPVCAAVKPALAAWGW